MRFNRQIAFDSLAYQIQSGAISSRQQLRDEIIRRGWTILKEGDGYFSIRAENTRFRFRFDFMDSTYEGWIYALVAFNQYERACYIGYTGNFQARMEEHRKVQRLANPNHLSTSSELFLWAKRRKLEVNVILLEQVFGVSKMTNREAEWTNAAKKTVWIMPGGERWGSRAKRPMAFSQEASNHLVLPNFSQVNLTAARRLRDVVNLNIPPNALLAI